MNPVPSNIARAVITCGAVAALATACSSSTSGSGSSGNGNAAGGSGHASSGPAPAPATGSGGGGSTGNFCTDWSHLGGNLSKIMNPGDVRQQIVARFDQLAAEAPAEIKSAVADVDQYVHGAINGSPDPSAAQKLAGDFQQIGTWIATNCH